MKNTIIFIIALLVVWIAGCSYYYVCKVRMDCDAGIPATETSAVPAVAENPDSLMMESHESQLSIPSPYTLMFNWGAVTCVTTGEDKNHFALIKQYIVGNPGGQVSVTGHADNTGSEPVNDEISKQRAEYIRQLLLEAGIPAENLTLSAKGEMEPIADNNSEIGRAKNRRVDIQTNKN